MNIQEVYNIAFKKIMDEKRIKSYDLMEFIRETVDKNSFRDSELATVFELLTINPNISSTTQMNVADSFIEFVYIGPKIKFVSIKDPTQVETGLGFDSLLYLQTDNTGTLIERAVYLDGCRIATEEDNNTQDHNNDNFPYEKIIRKIYDQAVNIIKEKKNIDISSLLIHLGELNKDMNITVFYNAIRKLIGNRSGIKINGSIYPYDPDTVFIYNNLPNLDEYLKHNNFKISITNSNSKSEPKYICPKCGKNVRKILNIIKPSNPIKYKYECDECDYVAYHEV